MIPSDIPINEFHGSYGENQVYNALRMLPEEYIVFHSVSWQRKGSKGQVLWGESDFTIFNPKRGLIVIEVKSGGIKHRDGRWYQSNTLTKKETYMKDPLMQASGSKYKFANLLEPLKEDGHKYWVEAAVWFTSVENKSIIGDLPPAYVSDIVLTLEDLSSPTKSIERIFNYYKMYENQNYSIEDVNWVINNLSPTFAAIPSFDYDLKEQSYAFHRMTQEQSALLDYLEEQRVAAIQGGAGTGKTMLAIEKAKRLSADGKVLFLCFNRFLLNFLKTTYENEYPNIAFFNLPALMHEKTGFVELGNPVAVTEYLNTYDLYDWDYKHIVIDEGQDFSSDHIPILSTIAEVQEGSFYVFFDRNQLVQQRHAIDWLNAMECRLVLTSNCRNTKNIAVTSYRPIGIEKIKMKSDVPGEKPTLYISKTKVEACERISKIIRQCTDRGLKRSDIVILTVKTEESSIFSDVASFGGYRVTREPGSPGILFTSSRKFKGLESPVIIIVDMDDSVFLNEEARRVLYVGASRARNILEFVSMLDDEQQRTIAEHLSGQVSKNAKFVIASQLKVKIAVE